jgi:hypothetical protein
MGSAAATGEIRAAERKKFLKLDTQPRSNRLVVLRPNEQRRRTPENSKDANFEKSSSPSSDSGPRLEWGWGRRKPNSGVLSSY